MGGKAEELNELGAKNPELLETLEKITDPEVSNEDFFDTIKTFNGSHMNEKEGSYQTISLRGDHGDITVKHYKNGSISISADWRE